MRLKWINVPEPAELTKLAPMRMQSGGGQPHSKTLTRGLKPQHLGQVAECFYFMKSRAGKITTGCREH